MQRCEPADVAGCYCARLCSRVAAINGRSRHLVSCGLCAAGRNVVCTSDVSGGAASQGRLRCCRNTYGAHSCRAVPQCEQQRVCVVSGQLKVGRVWPRSADQVLSSRPASQCVVSGPRHFVASASVELHSGRTGTRPHVRDRRERTAPLAVSWQRAPNSLFKRRSFVR